MEKRILFYVHDFHGESTIHSEELVEKFGQMTSKELSKNSVEKEFIKICDKQFPNLGVMRLRGKVIELRSEKEVEVEIISAQNYFMRSDYNYIRKRVVDNFSMLSCECVGDPKEKRKRNIIESKEDEFEIDSINYKFSVNKAVLG